MLKSVSLKSKSGLSLFLPSRWGLPVDAADRASVKLDELFDEYRTCFETSIHDTSRYAVTYIRTYSF